jgi:hypothetical protein
VVQIWPGQTVTSLHTISPGHIWTTLYYSLFYKQVENTRRSQHQSWESKHQWKQAVSHQSRFATIHQSRQAVSHQSRSAIDYQSRKAVTSPGTTTNMTKHYREYSGRAPSTELVHVTSLQQCRPVWSISLTRFLQMLFPSDRKHVCTAWNNELARGTYSKHCSLSLNLDSTQRSTRSRHT